MKSKSAVDADDGEQEESDSEEDKIERDFSGEKDKKHVPSQANKHIPRKEHERGHHMHNN